MSNYPSFTPPSNSPSNLKELYGYRGEQQGCGYLAARGLFVAMAVIVGLFFVLSCGVLALYASVARDLPPASELKNRAAQFNSTRILDRNGKLLFELNDPNAGRRLAVPLSQMPPAMIQATVATEDPTFYNNPGFDIVGIARALYRVLIRGEEVGGSTITQQLIKLVYKASARTPERKVREIILAQEVTRVYPKDEILEIYLNEIYYGNQSYGIEAASQTYFGKHASELTLPEASFLAGLPQAPAFYDPYTNFDDAKERQRIVLNLMIEHPVVVNARGEVRRLSTDEAQKAYDAPLKLQPPKAPVVNAPHFVQYVRSQLEDKYGAQDIYRLGLVVTTTLDLDWQNTAERIARAQVDKLKAQSVSNASLVALDANTGGILAMLGSVDFNNKDIGGQVNVSIRPRQPGSSIKPVTYIAALERGWTPATLILDNKTTFPSKPTAFTPVNYDGKFHGPETVRDSLANSLNIPAVKTLQFVGVPEMIKMAERLGIRSLSGKNYDNNYLSLTLGGGEVTLMEMASAYSVFANQGKRVAITPFLRITDGSGKEIPLELAATQEAVKPQLTYLITAILSDNNARALEFGLNSPLRLTNDRPAAVKTGTTNDSHDNWTLGYTAEGLVVGVWVGNNNGSPMKGTSGVTGAAPIWHDFMDTVLKNSPNKPFTVPADIVVKPICADTGFVANELCSRKRNEVFWTANVPPTDMVHKSYVADKFTGQPYNERCPANLREERTVVSYNDDEFRKYAQSAWQWRPGFGPADFYKGNELRDWALAAGIPQPPAPSNIQLTAPNVNDNVQGTVSLIGSADDAQVAAYVTEFGVGDNPQAWGNINTGHNKVTNSVLAQWDTTKVANGLYSLRVVARAADNRAIAEACTRVNVANENTPTATPVTLTPTPTNEPREPSPTATTAPTATAPPTATNTPIIPLPTILPKNTPTPTSTCTPAPVGNLLTPTPTLIPSCPTPKGKKP